MKIALILLSAALVPVRPSGTLASPAPAQALHVVVEWQKAAPTSRGLAITGRIRNTGSRALTYTQVMPLLTDQKGKVVYRANGYLTVSPLKPGQAAEFRAYAADVPAFTRMTLALRESGRSVTVEQELARPQRQARLQAHAYREQPGW